ncbi:MAG: hypothetical protein KIT79_05910 [Deltaproteobacteria bacterium]|nr:hypothetical protein [Deltaproteobacteria bacterium]
MGDNAPLPDDAREPGPADPGEGQISYEYSRKGRMPLVLVFAWAVFFSFMLYYLGTWMVPTLIEEMGVR